MNRLLTRRLLPAALLGALLAALPAAAQDAYVKRGTARETWAASTAAVADQAKLGPWYYVGPFDGTDGKGFRTAYPPEQRVDLSASYPGKGGRTLHWLRGDRFRDGETNSLNIFEDNDNIAVYLYRTITVPAARDLPVLLGSDDTISVWLNGEQLLAHDVGRACRLGDEQLVLKLHAGENAFLMKVCQGGGPAGFAFAVNNGSEALLSRLARDFPAEINDLLIEQDWLRQAKAHKLQPGTSIAPEDDAPGGCDGVKDGGTGFHTNLEERPWWQVDLGGVCTLSQALLYNREDSAARNNVLIMLLSEDGEHWRQVWQNDGTLFHGARDNKPREVSLAGQKARYMRLQLPGKEYLHLDEVEVFGSDPASGNAAETNLALNKPATESSSSPWSTYTPLKNPGAPDLAGQRARYREAAREALQLARRTLELVHSARPLPEKRRELEALSAELEQAPATADWQALFLRTRRLRRDIVLSHPQLDFERLLLVKRGPTLYSHMVDQYEGRHSQPGDGLVLLDSWKSAPRATPLLQGKLPRGSVQHAGLSFDGKKVVFSYCDHTVQPATDRRFFLYELDLGSGSVRQLTGVPGVDKLEAWAGRSTVAIEDFDPCYLPDGGIAFVSTRNQGFGRCHGGRYTPSYVLYRCDADGRNIRRLSYGEANEWNPSVLPDGRILYTRWDYINRHDVLFQSLWTIHPDGSGTAHYYGNSTRNPCMVAQAEAIPGSERVSALATAHHSYSAGSIMTVDRRLGEDGLTPVKRVTPEVSFPETEGWPIGSYCDPWPLSEDFYLAAYDANPLAVQGTVAKADGYGLYLVDSLGGRELLYRDPSTCCVNPLALEARPTPPVLPSALAGEAPEGVFAIQNLYDSVEQLLPGSIKSLRVVRIFEQPAASSADRSAVTQEIVKSVLGTVPVSPDGGVVFRAPAQVPLLFQVLDENNVSLFSMRSQVYLQPGETMSCAGCHEPRGSTPRPRGVLSGTKAAAIIPAPGPQYQGGFSFARTVQPVLDRYCLRCHGLGHTAAGLSLLGTPTSQYSQAYDALTARPGLVSLAHRNVQTDISKPGDYGARAGKLAAFLQNEHRQQAPLDRDSFTRVVEWLDLNCQYFGDYEFSRSERRQPDEQRVAALRQYVARNCNSCHGGLSEQPLAALVNVAAPDESRVLQAPLAQSAGGWGRCKQVWADRSAAGYKTMREVVLAATGSP